MARKTTDAVTEAEMTMDAPVAKIGKADPWKEEIEIRLPKAPRGGDNFLVASVNGRVFKIKRGETVKVPAPIAEVIANSEAMQDEADAYKDSLLNK